MGGYLFRKDRRTRSILGLRHPGTVPATGAAYLTQRQMVNAGGYYFVNTGPLTYDMVSKTDTRIWISWVLAK